MYYNLIKSYVDKLTKEDIRDFSLKQGINLTDNEINVIYRYIKEDWQTLYYGNEKVILDELKKEIREEVFNKIESLYITSKEKLL